MVYLLDTDAIIHILAGKPQAVALFKQIQVEAIAISLLTVGEVYEGAFAYANPRNTFIPSVNFLTLSASSI